MKLTSKDIVFLLIIVNAVIISEASRTSGGRLGGRRRGGRRQLSRMPILVQRQNPSEYYEHKDGAKIVKSSHFELDYMLGRKITFFCMARGLPRPEITWFKDDIELYHHKFFQVHESTLGNDTIKSKMEIDPTTQKTQDTMSAKLITNTLSTGKDSEQIT